MSDVKNTIIQEATDLFTKKGCKVVTMDDIARSLGISKRTIYENFKDKEELLSYCLDSLFEQVDKELTDLMKSENIIQSFLEFKDSASGIFQKVSKDFFLDVKRYYPKAFEKAIKTRINTHEKKTLKFLEKGKIEGYFLKSLDTDLVALMIQEIGNLIGNEDVFSLRKFTKEEIFKNGFIFYLRGISTQKGIETINKYYKLS